MKRLSAILLAAVLAFGAAGCTDKADKQGDGSGDVPTLTWYVPGDPQNDIAEINAAASKITREKIGADIELKFIDTGAYKERMSMNMASSTEFDLCFIGYLYPYSDAVDMGGLLEIGDLLEKYAPELLKSMPSYFLEAATTENGIYAVPNQQITGFGTGVYIRKDLAEKYNVDTSKINNFEDLEPFAQLIKDNEPELVPSVKLTSASFIEKDGMDSKITSMAISSPTVWWDVEKEKAIPLYEMPGIKESVKKVNEWYKKGYIRQDVAINSDSGLGDSYSRAGRYAIVTETNKPGVLSDIKTMTGYEYVEAFTTPPVMAYNSPLSTTIAVSRTSKHPEEAVKFINLVNTDKELYNIFCFGIEGKHYTCENNRVYQKENSGYAPSADWKFGNQFNAMLKEGQNDDDWEKTVELNNMAVKAPFMGIFFNTEDILTELAQISKVNEQYVTALMDTGVQDPDTYWDEYISAMKKAGIDKVIDHYQTQINDFMKNKK